MARMVLVVGAQVIGAAVGGPIGAAVGGALGGLLANQLFPEPGQHSEGQRLDDLSVAGGSEGAAIPMAWGNARLPGQMIVASDLQEHVTTETISGGKGGGPKVTHTTYAYTCTYAAAYGEARLATPKLRRLWANKQLVEDYAASADMTLDGQRAIFYDGTQTEPDPDLEALIGTGNVPAYTGVMYSVHPDEDLADYGNRPPAREAEICTAYAATVPNTKVVLRAAVQSLGCQTYSPASGKLYITLDDASAPGSYLVEVDPWSKTVVQEISLGLSNDTGCLALGTFGKYGTGELLLTYARGVDELRWFDATNNLRPLGSSSGTYYGIFAETENWVLLRAATQFRVMHKQTYGGYWVTNPVGYTIGWAAVRLGPNQFLVAMDNEPTFGVLTIDGLGNTSWDITTNATSTITDIFENAVVDDDGIAWWTGDDSVGSAFQLVATDQTGQIIDTYDLNALGSPGWSVGSGHPLFSYDASTRSIYLHASGKITSFDTETHSITLYSDGTGGNGCFYHPETDTCWTGDNNDSGDVVAYAVRLHAVEPAAIDAADVLEDLCEQAGMSSGQVDVSAITTTLGGYVHASQGSASADIAPLLRVCLGSAALIDWQLQFVPLGGASVMTLDSEHLGARESGSAPIAPLQTIEPKGQDVPRKLQLQYISSDSDLQPAMAEYEHPTAVSQRVVTLSINATLTDAQAAPLSQQLLQLASEQVNYQFSLPRGYGQLDASDPITLPTDQGDKRVRLTKIDRGANGIMRCEAVSDNPEHLNATAVAGGSGVRSASILANSPAQLIVLDTPLLRDLDQDHPGPYLTAFTYGTGFPGVAFFSSADGQDYAEVAAIDAEPVVGTCATEPSAVDFEDWDDTNTLRINLRTSGTLASATEAALLAGGNALAWGIAGRWEIVQFGTATLVDTGIYDLSHLLRGRRGTDVHMDSHAAGDWMVLLTESTLVRQVLRVADIGTDRWIKAAAFNRALADTVAREYTVGATPLTPYSPHNIVSAQDGTTPGDTDITWDWRTRAQGVYGGPNSVTDGSQGALSDDDSGTLHILDSSDTELTTYAVTGESHTYTETQALTDYSDGVPAYIRYTLSQDPASASVADGYPSAVQTHLMPYLTVVQSTAAVAYYDLEDTGATAADASGNGNHGTFSGTVTKSQTGDVGDAVLLVASGSGLIDLGNAINSGCSGAENIVMEFIFKPASLPTTGNYMTLLELNIGGNNAGPQVLLDDAGFSIGGRSAVTAPWQYVTSAQTISTTAWSHLVVKFDFPGDTIRAWYNGTQIIDQAVTFGASYSPGTPNYQDVIGAKKEKLVRFFDGYLDEVMVYTDMTDARVEEHVAAYADN